MSDAPSQAQSRRSFLISAAAAGGGLLVGFRVPTAGGQSLDAALEPNAFVRIDRTGAIRVTRPSPRRANACTSCQSIPRN